MKTIKLIALALAISVSFNAFASSSKEALEGGVLENSDEIREVEEQSRVRQAVTYISNNKVKCAVMAVGAVLVAVAAGLTIDHFLWKDQRIMRIMRSLKDNHNQFINDYCNEFADEFNIATQYEGMQFKDVIADLNGHISAGFLLVDDEQINAESLTILRDRLNLYNRLGLINTGPTGVLWGGLQMVFN
jgi:hypothetical protein